MTLPETKTEPNLSIVNAKLLIYGSPGVGKTTLAANINGDETLLLATEPGYGGISAFVQGISSWSEFNSTCAELAKGEHKFTTIAIDTVDELFRMCQDSVMKKAGVTHPSDLEWGKGYQLLTDEFRLKIGALCNLGYGVIFTSHSKDEEVKQRVGTITVTSPTLSSQAAKFLLGFVDYVLLATSIQTEDGEKRILRTAPSENWIAKSRIALPSELALDAKTLRDALTGKASK